MSKSNASSDKRLLKYQEFMSKEIPNQRKKNPGLQATDYMKLAADEWSKYKELKGITTQTRPRATGSKTVKKTAGSKTARKKTVSKTTKKTTKK